MSNSDDCIYCQADKAGKYIGPEYYAAYDAAWDAAIEGVEATHDAAVEAANVAYEAAILAATTIQDEAFDHADKVALAAARRSLR